MSEAIKPRIISKNVDSQCTLCGNEQGLWLIHFPEYIYKTGAFEAPPWFSHNKFLCPSCRFLWTDVFDKLDTAEYGKKYTEANYDHHRRPTEDRMAFAPMLISKLVKLSGGSRFLDYGCGYNYPYIYELRSRGFDLWGVDISAGINYSRYIRRLPFENFPDDFFDGIFSIDVMEHLAHFDNDFSNMKRILKPGGYMLHNSISLDQFWRGDNAAPDDPMVWSPWHCTIFSERSAAVLAERLGLVFKGMIPTRSDTGLAFLFRKAGAMPAARFNALAKAAKLWRLARYSAYFHKNYSKSPSFHLS